MALIALPDIQGISLRGYRHPYASFLFFRFSSPGAGRRFLASCLDEVTSAAVWDQEPPLRTLNLALTFRGLEALGLPGQSLNSFPPDFRQGMAARAERELGDTGNNAPECWEIGHDPAELHLLAVVYGATAAALSEGVRRLVTSAQASGVIVTWHQDGGHLSGGTEHFGFRDGISKIAVVGADGDANPGDGKPGPSGSWAPIATGEFLLGHEGESAPPEPVPEPPALGRDGSYFVLRKIRQWPGRLRAFLQAATRSSENLEYLAAKMVGRWPSGAPMALAAHADDPTLAKNSGRANDFRYGDDVEGHRCPVGAHIRRVNPRDALDHVPDVLVRRRRLQRRGIPFGPELPQGVLKDDETERGIVFAAVVGSIARQYEFVQRLWINDGDFLSKGKEADPLIGDHRAAPYYAFKMPGQRPRRLVGLPDFVSVRGGEYCFLPSLPALRLLAGGVRL